MDLEEDVRNREQNQKEMRADIQTMLQYQHDSQHECLTLKQKCAKKKAKVKFYRDTLEYREQELAKKDEVIRKLSSSNEEAEKRVKKIQLKLRQ